MAVPSRSQDGKCLIPLNCDQDRYWVALATYYRIVNRRERQAQWMVEDFDRHVIGILWGKFGNNLQGEPLRVLGVGSREGHQELLQLKKLKTKFPRIHVSVIEPSKPDISKYQQTVQQNSHSEDTTGIDFEWYNQTFQDYMKSIRTGKKYHFISIVHTVYYMGDVDEVVRQLYDLLEPGGMVYMVLDAERTGTGKLRKTFPNLAKEDQNSSATKPFKSADNVMSTLQEHHMAYTQITHKEQDLDITPCFKQPESPDAELLMDWLTFTAYFKSSVEESCIVEVMDFIKRNARVEKTSEGEERFYFDTEIDTLLIFK